MTCCVNWLHFVACVVKSGASNIHMVTIRLAIFLLDVSVLENNDSCRKSSRDGSDCESIRSLSIGNQFSVDLEEEKPIPCDELFFPSCTDELFGENAASLKLKLTSIANDDEIPSVDDEPNVLKAIKRTMYPGCPVPEMAHMKKNEMARLSGKKPSIFFSCGPGPVTYDPGLSAP